MREFKEGVASDGAQRGSMSQLANCCPHQINSAIQPQPRRTKPARSSQTPKTIPTSDITISDRICHLRLPAMSAPMHCGVCLQRQGNHIKTTFALSEFACIRENSRLESFALERHTARNGSILGGAKTSPSPGTPWRRLRARRTAGNMKLNRRRGDDRWSGKSFQSPDHSITAIHAAKDLPPTPTE